VSGVHSEGIQARSLVETCVVCGKPRYQKHAERCAGRPPYAIARDIVDGGDYERVEVLRLAREYLAVCGIRP
jgi:hypothetical protein